MKNILILLMLCISACNSKSQFRKATIYGMTHIAVPEQDRKHFGFDSIQLLVRDDHKIEANFCYPNNWLWAKDTVYTTDTAYRRYIFGFRVTNNAMLVFKEGIIKVNNYFDTSIIVNDSIQITITKIKP